MYSLKCFNLSCWMYLVWEDVGIIYVIGRMYVFDYLFYWLCDRIGGKVRWLFIYVVW